MGRCGGLRPCLYLTISPKILTIPAILKLLIKRDNERQGQTIPKKACTPKNEERMGKITSLSFKANCFLHVSILLVYMHVLQSKTGEKVII